MDVTMIEARSEAAAQQADLVDLAQRASKVLIEVGEQALAERVRVVVRPDGAVGLRFDPCDG